MARSVDVAILGTGLRGLWLSTELAKMGWSVSWIQMTEPKHPVLENGFEFDDWVWQLGPHLPESKLVRMSEKFISEVLRPEFQKNSVQVLTPEGPLELSGGVEFRTMQKFFKSSHTEILGFLESVRRASNLDEKTGRQLIAAYGAKIFSKPLSERWILEWLGAIRRTRALQSKTWVEKWGGEVLDPSRPFGLLKHGLSETIEHALKWAEKQGVIVYRVAKIAGIDVDGKKATGIVFDRAEGYLKCERLIFSCSSQLVEKKFPKVAKAANVSRNVTDELWVWIRCGFLLKPYSKPAGLFEFSSFVLDPLMPLVESNFGLLRWKESNKGDSLTVWTRVPISELKRKSFLLNLQEGIQNNLENLFLHLSSQIVETVPFEDHLLTSENLSHDEHRFVFSEEANVTSFTTKLKNVFSAGPELDRGLEFLSQLATEMRLLEKLIELRKKELPRDRPLHPAGDGRSLVNPE